MSTETDCGKLSIDKKSAVELIHQFRRQAAEFNALADQMELTLGITASTTLIIKDGRSNFEKVRDFLQNGPAERAEIMSATNIPVGSIGPILKDHFRKIQHGLWSLID